MDRTKLHNAHVRTIADYLAVLGGWVFKVHGGMMQRPGVPDALCCLKGRLIAVEVKTGAATRTPAQRDEHERLERAGAISILAHSVDDVEDRLVAEGLVTPSLQRKRAI